MRTLRMLKHKRNLAAVTAAAVLVGSALIAAGSFATGAPTSAHASPVSSPKTANTETEARAEAAKTGSEVEVLSLREPHREVFANPDGTMTAVEHTEPVRTLKNNTWVRIDPTLQRTADGSVVPTAATLDMAFSGGGAGPLATITKAGKSMTLGWKGRLPEPILDGASATYKSVMPDVDLVITAKADGFSHVLVVNSARAGANAALARIEMPLGGTGTQVRTTAAGGAEVVDSSGGGVMLRANPPAMWDSSGKSVAYTPGPTRPGGHSSVVDVVSDGRTLSLSPDLQLLRSDETVYPVFIDPVWRDDPTNGWAMVDSGHPNTKYWKFNGAEDEGLGLCPQSSGWCGSALVKRLYYRMPTTFYKGKDILSATFGVTLRHTWTAQETGHPSDQADLYQMSGTMSSTDVPTWNDAPGSATKIATAYPGAPSRGNCAYSTTYATEWNVQSTLQSAANSGKGSLTFRLQNAHESDSGKWMRYCPNAHLRVKYNSPPDKPSKIDLSFSGGVCAYSGENVPVINKLPELRAWLDDPDDGVRHNWGTYKDQVVREYLKPQFKLVWGPNDANSWTSTLPSATQPAGTQFTLDLADVANPPSLPEDTEIGWIARAHDGETYGPWSWDGAPERCVFKIDGQDPDPPVVTSAEFPSGSTTDGLGKYGTFTFDSNSTDVVKYTYDYLGDGVAPVDVPTTGGAPQSRRLMPSKVGTQLLQVTAYDAAGNSSSGSHSFKVYAAAPVGGWSLSDPVGSTAAASGDPNNANPASAGGGVAFGLAGPKEATAARLDGGAGAYLAPATRDLVNTSEGFAVSAWVRLEDTTKDHTAVSVNGLREAGFVLGYDSASGKWAFQVPDYDLQRFSTWKLTGGVATAEWTHLLGTYDPETGELQLWVNGQLVASKQRGSRWNATGAIQIGRGYRGGFYADNWSGDLADVRVYDHIATGAEAERLAAVRRAYWQLNESTNNVSPAYGGIGDAMSLLGYQAGTEGINTDSPIMGTGSLGLSGQSQYANAGSTTVDITRPYTFTMRAALAAVPQSRSMTVMSIRGSNTDLVTLQYATPDATHPKGQWVLSVAKTDTVGATRTVITSAAVPHANGWGQFLSVVYNPSLGKITLRVDGETTSNPDGVPFVATSGVGTLQIGRGGAGAGVDYFSGMADDARIYRGAVDDDTLESLRSLQEQPQF